MKSFYVITRQFRGAKLYYRKPTGKATDANWINSADDVALFAKKEDLLSEITTNAKAFENVDKIFIETTLILK